MTAAAGYSPVRHLALSLFLGRDASECLMAMLTSYCDAAGHPDGKESQDALTVYGHISDVGKWIKFETAWEKALRAVGIAGPFHMADFMAGRDDFKDWKGRTEDQAALLAQLIGIVKRNVYKAFGETILLDDWRDTNDEYTLKESHCTPYALAGFIIMDRMVRFAGRKDPRTLMPEFVFENGDKHKGDFIWMMDNVISANKRGLSGMSPIFKPKGLAPLQAADMTGWIQRTAIRARQTQSVARIPESLRRSIRQVAHIPNKWGYMDKEVLVKFCQDYAIPKRGEKRQWRGIAARAKGVSAKP